MCNNPAVKTSTRRFIFSCKCGVKALDYTATRHFVGEDKWGAAIYTAPKYTREVDGVSRDISADAWCEGCKNYRKSAKVIGRKTDHKCGARCTASKGPNCDCSCGGANHGKAYL
jgi:hypothetical protein